MAKLLSYRLNKKGEVLLPQGCSILSIEHVTAENITAFVSGWENASLELYRFVVLNLNAEIPEGATFMNMMCVRGVSQAIFQVSPTNPLSSQSNTKA